MKIKTTRFGTINISKDKIIYMPFGMLGFSDKKRFVLFPHKENSPFFWYQSADDPALAFVIISPFLFAPAYSIDADETAKKMSWNDAVESDYEVYVIAGIPRGEPDKITANMIGPLLINVRKREAVQMVIPNSPYSHKFPLSANK